MIVRVLFSLVRCLHWPNSPIEAVALTEHDLGCELDRLLRVFDAVRVFIGVCEGPRIKLILDRLDKGVGFGAFAVPPAVDLGIKAQHW